MVTIILPVDFGETTDKLVDSAISFAKDVKGKICLIHVAPADIGFVVGEVGFQYFPEVEKSEIREELIMLNNYQQRILSHDIDCEHILRQGIAGDNILEYAKQKNANYITIGSHGRSGVYDVFIGSLTKEISRRSEIPVLIIPVHHKKV